MRRYHLSIVGFEASQGPDTKTEATLLTSYAPKYVKAMLEGSGAQSGYSLEDAVGIIAALRHLVDLSSSHLLEDAYQSMEIDAMADVDRGTITKIMQAYLLRWMMGDDMESVRLLEANDTLREISFEDWPVIAEFAQGHVDAFVYKQQQLSGGATTNLHVSNWNSMRPNFSFSDAQTIMGSMALTFGDFWETECQGVKESLVAMDKTNSGRVKVSDFHGAALNGEWRFSESKEYLRQMGALDETSSWQGPRVVITNYLQAPSNCIISTDHYRVCCSNECEAYIEELESKLKTGMASPEAVLSVIERQASGLDDSEPRITSTLQAELHQIANQHSGKVPIHGRLFAQWLHYVFPLDCPFPHKSGTTTSLTPLAFGDEYMATEEEMENHSTVAAQEPGVISGVADPDAEFMSQWSNEEELLTDLAAHSWQADLSTSALGLLLLGGIGFVLSKTGVISVSGKEVLPTRLKSHYV